MPGKGTWRPLMVCVYPGPHLGQKPAPLEEVAPGTPAAYPPAACQHPKERSPWRPKLLLAERSVPARRRPLAAAEAQSPTDPCLATPRVPASRSLPERTVPAWTAPAGAAADEIDPAIVPDPSQPSKPPPASGRLPPGPRRHTATPRGSKKQEPPGEEPPGQPVSEEQPK